MAITLCPRLAHGAKAILLANVLHGEIRTALNDAVGKRVGKERWVQIRTALNDTVGKPQAGCGARHWSLSLRGGAGL